MARPQPAVELLKSLSLGRDVKYCSPGEAPPHGQHVQWRVRCHHRVVAVRGFRGEVDFERKLHARGEALEAPVGPPGTGGSGAEVLERVESRVARCMPHAPQILTRGRRCSAAAGCCPAAAVRGVGRGGGLRACMWRATIERARTRACARWRGSSRPREETHRSMWPCGPQSGAPPV